MVVTDARPVGILALSLGEPIPGGRTEQHRVLRDVNARPLVRAQGEPLVSLARVFPLRISTLAVQPGTRTLLPRQRGQARPVVQRGRLLVQQRRPIMVCGRT